jgi:hypothetical protein
MGFEGAVNMARDMYNAIYSPLMKLAKDDIRALSYSSKPDTQLLTAQQKTVVTEKNEKVMESEVEKSQSPDITSPEPSVPLESSINQPLLPQTNEPLLPSPQIDRKFSDFLERLPEYLGKVFIDYKLPIISFASVIVSIVAIKIILAVLDIINEIPQLDLVFELTGISYVFWFAFRYLLKASTRQELAAQIRLIQKEIFEGQDL